MDQSSLTMILGLVLSNPDASKAVAKLFDTVADQMAMFLEPIHIRQKGKAQADVLLYEGMAEASLLVSKEEAKQQIKVMKVENKIAIQELQDRAVVRVRRLEENRQANFESITRAAIEELPDSVSDEPVDQDWVARFFDDCKDVGNEEMQRIWAKLLAGEVGRPGSFSLRTLSIVKSMSKEEAGLFTRFCTTVWEEQGSGSICIIPDLYGEFMRERLNLRFADLLRLESLGLVKTVSSGSFNVSVETGSLIDLQFGGVTYGLHKPRRVHQLVIASGGPNVSAGGLEGMDSLLVGQAFLTASGNELIPIAGRLSDAAIHDEYLHWSLGWLRSMGWHVTISNSQSSSTSVPNGGET